MQDMVGKYFLDGNKICKIENASLKPFTGQPAVYEVIRVIDGVPVFFRDHIERMEKSLKSLGSSLNISLSELKERIHKLLELNEERFCNIKIIIDMGAGNQTSYIYISESYYPTPREFETGVKVDLYRAERPDPNIKKLNLIYREQLNNFISQNDLFEALLVNRKNEITEGSKSNVFFVKGNNIITAPDEAVLKGVTRKYVLDVCKQLNLNIIKTPVNVNELSAMEGLFLSGTSIKVLPVSAVGKLEFESSRLPVVIDIRKQFDLVLERDIAGYAK